MSSIVQKLAFFFMFLGLFLSVSAKGQEQVFDAEIVMVDFLRGYKGATIIAAIDPRFVVKLRLLKKVENLGDKDSIVTFAIHSPARDLWLTDYTSAGRKKIRLKLTTSENQKSLRLQRISNKQRNK